MFVRHYGKFLIAGTFFSTVEEFLTVVLLRGDVKSYIFTLVILFPVYLTFAFVIGKIAPKVITRPGGSDWAVFLLPVTAGMAIEWFIIGLSPWSNPNANPILMLGFQMGMFSFWATVGYAPVLFIRQDIRSTRTRRSLMRFYIPWFIVVYSAGFSMAGDKRFLAVIGGIILGYLVVLTLLTRYLIQGSRLTREETPVPG